MKALLVLVLASLSFVACKSTGSQEASSSEVKAAGGGVGSSEFPASEGWILAGTSITTGGSFGANVTQPLFVPATNYGAIGVVYRSNCGLNVNVNATLSPVDFSWSWDRYTVGAFSVARGDFNDTGLVTGLVMTYGVAPFGQCQVDLYLQRI